MMNLVLPLFVLLLLACLFVLWPLWRYKKVSANREKGTSDEGVRQSENVRIYREHFAELEKNLASGFIDKFQFEQLVSELGRNLLQDEASVLAAKPALGFVGVKALSLFILAVFICGAFFYWQRGAIQDVAIQELTQAKTDDEYQSMAQNRAPNSTYAHSLIDEYTDRLKAKPDSVQYWFLLARTQMEVRNFAQAAKAYQQVLDRDSQSPMIMAELAQAMFLRDGNKMSPEVAGLAKSAVLLDPKNTMALGLLGVDAFTRQDYRGTILFWRRSVVILGEQSQGGQALMAGIEKAMQAYVAAGGQLADLNVDSPYTLKFSVSLADGVKVAGDQAVFIYARAWKGSPMPLAINRLKVSELPKTITLDETMAMSPAASLATVADIEIVARISPEGSAQAKIGDWQASQGPISMSAIPKTLNLVITEQLTAESLSAK